VHHANAAPHFTIWKLQELDTTLKGVHFFNIVSSPAGMGTPSVVNGCMLICSKPIQQRVTSKEL
jgi:hypothetical protein